MRFGVGQRLSVNITAMAHVKDGNRPTTVVDFVDHAVVAYPDAPPVTTRQLEATRWSGVLGQAANSVADSGIRVARQCAQLFLSTAQDCDRISHWRFCSISLTACLNGMTSSPELLAAS